MRKVKLDLDAIQVESFEASGGGGTRGTVRGHLCPCCCCDPCCCTCCDTCQATCPATCPYTCAGDTCISCPGDTCAWTCETCYVKICDYTEFCYREPIPY